MAPARVGRATVAAIGCAACAATVAVDLAHGVGQAAAICVAACLFMLASMFAEDVKSAADEVAERYDPTERDRFISRYGVDLDEIECRMGRDGSRPERASVLLRERSIVLRLPDGNEDTLLFRECEILPEGRLALRVADGFHETEVVLPSAAKATEIKDAYDKATGRVWLQR